MHKQHRVLGLKIDALDGRLRTDSAATRAGARPVRVQDAQGDDDDDDQEIIVMHMTALDELGSVTAAPGRQSPVRRLLNHILAHRTRA